MQSIMEMTINSLDTEITKLQRAKVLLLGLQNGEHKPGRPSLQLIAKRAYKMSPESRKRLSDAAKLRWKKRKAEAKQLAKAG